MKLKNFFVLCLLLISLSTIFLEISGWQAFAPLSRLASVLNLNFYPKVFVGAFNLNFNRHFRFKVKTSAGELQEMDLSDIFQVEDGIRYFSHRKAISLATETRDDQIHNMSRKAVRWLVCRNQKIMEVEYEISRENKFKFSCQ
jgi:hypothetical protein